MQSAEMGIGELADAAGLSRRAIRFYVQQGLIPAPLGRGRGRHYDASHLERLRRIAELQAAGHSLDAIRKILGGREAPPVTASPSPRRTTRPALSAELWTRLRLMEGVELQFDAARFNPPVERLLALRDAVREAFQTPDGGSDDEPRDEPREERRDPSDKKRSNRDSNNGDGNHST